MSAVWVKICAILCLCYAAEMKEVVWREVGESVTIQCRSRTNKDLSLHFKRGLWEDMDIAQITNELRLARGEKERMKFTERKLEEVKNMIDRVEFNGKYPNVDFLLKNLSVDDTGAYWCLYLKDVSNTRKMMKGDGSVIVVVKENSYARAEAMQGSDVPTMNMPWHVPLVYAVPAAVLFLGIILSFIIWIKRRTESADITVEQTHAYAETVSTDADEERVEAEAEDETVRVQLANPTESLNTSDHSVKSDAG
ncbi:uncharacterized protein LOC108166493 [Poecilia reticulata]|uniref:uncharacterized protein LOC108166493 n=1 Tax=Poecilia reticulata TaxID=8081 RepID=UPI0007EBC358|nr:PREDICTED: uncharacterized protein LOC108166493 [Poecilia reticulata]